MSKLIKPTPEYLQDVLKEFEKALSDGKFADGKITFTKTIGQINRKATVFFTKEAWYKMQALIEGFDKEVAWHGVAYRGEDENKDEYFITDILVYPQEVTGATVTTDQEKYEMWLMSHDDDVFNNIRMQGHSHVNMGVTPSSVDNSLYDRILDQLDDSMFYIFMIWNKKSDKTVKIYDLKKNVLFDTSDVTIEQLGADDQIDLQSLSENEQKAVIEFLTEYRKKKQTEAFVKSAKDMVHDKAPVRTKTGGYGAKSYGNGYYGSGGYYYGGGYYDDEYGYYSGYGYSQSNNQAQASTTTTSKDASGAPSMKGQSQNKVKRKGKRKEGKTENGAQIAMLSSAFDQDDYDYDPDGFYTRGF